MNLSSKPQWETIRSHRPRAYTLLLSLQARFWFPLNNTRKRKWLKSAQVQFALYLLSFFSCPVVVTFFKKMKVGNVFVSHSFAADKLPDDRHREFTWHFYKVFLILCVCVAVSHGKMFQTASKFLGKAVICHVSFQTYTSTTSSGWHLNFSGWMKLWTAPL